MKARSPFSLIYRASRTGILPIIIGSCALFSPLLSQASGPVLMHGAQTVVTADDLAAELMRMPNEVQVRLLASPDQLRQLVDNIYLRRATAQIAQQAGLASEPAIENKLRTARENILAEEWLNRKDKEGALSDQAAETYARGIYKAEHKRFEKPAETQARHILIQGRTPASKARAEKVLAELKAGSSFEELAKEYSNDPGSAAKGGDLGSFPKGRMIKAFEDALEALQKPGDISGLVESDFGYHIIRLEGRTPATMRSYDEVKEQLFAEARLKVQKEFRQKHVDQLRNQAKGDETALQEFIATQKATRK